MSMTREDREIQKMMEKDSPRNTVLSFVITIIFGILAALAAMTLNVVIKDGVTVIVNANLDSLQASQGGGIKNIASIIASIIMLGSWMTAFMVVWHKVEKAVDVKTRVKNGVVAIVIAIVAYIALGFVYYALISEPYVGQHVFPSPTVLINGVQSVLGG